MLNEKPLAKQLEYVNNIFKPRSRLSAEESLEAITVLIERHGATCFFCKKAGWVLKIEDDAIRESKGLPDRKRRVLVVHERIRGIFDSIVYENNIPKLLKWGNCVPACYSCNQREGSIEPKDIDKKTMTWQAKKSVVRDQFTKKVDIILAQKIHICKKMVINISSNAEHLHCSQEVLEEATKQNVGIRWDLINIENFNINCDYCKNYYGDNEHIIFMGKPPTKEQSDIESAMLEDDQ